MRTTKKSVASAIDITHEDLLENQSTYSTWYAWLISSCLAFLTWLFYYPSLRYAFQFDDIANIYRVFHIRHLTFKEALFSSTRWVAFWVNALNYRLGRFDPLYYRLFNVSFHILGGFLLFWLTYTCLTYASNSFARTYRLLIASITSALFLLHPVQTQTVSYVIQGRMEGLASIFIIAICLSFIGYTRSENPVLKILYLTSMFLSAIISCGTKEIAIIAPFLVLLIDWFFIAQGNVKSIISRLWIHLSLILFVVGIYIYFLKPSFFLNIFGLKMEARNNIGNLLTEAPGQKILPLHFFISQFKVILHYFAMFIWPFNISVEYDWKLVSHFFAADCFLPFIVLVSLCSYLGYRIYQKPTDIVAYCFAWFFICIAPRSTIIPSSELLADYKTYLASYGILMLFSYYIAQGVVILTHHIRDNKVKHYLPLVQYTCLLLVTLPLGFFTYKRNQVWRSAEEFWTNIIENAPAKARAYNNLGVALSERGALKEAIPLFKKAINMDRHYPDPWNNLAVAYSAEKKTDLAIETLKKAIDIHRYYPEAYNNLASFFITQKKFDEAEKMLNYALQLRPHYGKAFYNLGKIKFEQGNMDEALNCFKTACMEGDLDNEAGYTVYANAAMHCQKYDQAILPLQKLLSLRPHSIDIIAKLGRAYLGSGNFKDALQCLERVAQAHPQDAQTWFNIGECYNQLHNPKLALSAYQKAQDLKFQSPFLALRLAACMDQLGDKNASQDILKQYVQDPGAPENLKVVARKGLEE